jgi:hypothetical protein
VAGLGTGPELFLREGQFVCCSGIANKATSVHYGDNRGNSVDCVTFDVELEAITRRKDAKRCHCGLPRTEWTDPCKIFSLTSSLPRCAWRTVRRGDARPVMANLELRTVFCVCLSLSTVTSGIFTRSLNRDTPVSHTDTKDVLDSTLLCMRTQSQFLNSSRKLA